MGNSWAGLVIDEQLVLFFAEQSGSLTVLFARKLCVHSCIKGKGDEGMTREIIQNDAE